MDLWVIFELLFYLVFALTVIALYKLHKPTKMWIKSHWVIVAIASGMYLLIRLAIWGLMSLESFYQKMMLATMPMQLIMAYKRRGRLLENICTWQSSNPCLMIFLMI